MKSKEPCGCTHDATRWLSECSAHKAEEDAKHARAMAEHRQARGRTKSPTPASPTPDWLELPESASPT